MPLTFEALEGQRFRWGRLAASDPFTLVGYAGRLWIADFAGTDVLVVYPARLP